MQESASATEPEGSTRPRQPQGARFRARNPSASIRGLHVRSDPPGAGCCRRHREPKHRSTRGRQALEATSAPGAGRSEPRCTGGRRNRVQASSARVLKPCGRSAHRKGNRRGLRQQATHQSPWDAILVERVGFEPTSRCNREPDFESGAFDHSATSPFGCFGGSSGAEGEILVDALPLLRAAWSRPARAGADR